jgi:prepilin-type N-terminal cleavage/methylation domain-containing protein
MSSNKLFNNNYFNLKNQAGVTLIEMLVGLSLFSFAISQVNSYMEKSQRTNMALNAKQEAINLVQESLNDIERIFKKRESILSSDNKTIILKVKSKNIKFESACRATTVNKDKTAPIFSDLCSSCGCPSCGGQHIITRSTPTATKSYPPAGAVGLDKAKGAIICFKDNINSLIATVSAAYRGQDGELARITDERSFSKKKLNSGIKYK